MNEILLEKALRYMNRGIVGIDIAGSTNRTFKYSQYGSIYRRARKEGLGLTVHAGEDEGHQSVRQVIEQLDPDRIGHGVRACEDRDKLELVRKRAITLEVCPSSNLQTKVVKGVGQMKQIFKAFKESRVKYTINTDGPEMLMTNLRNEIDFLLRNGILTVGDVLQANKNAFKASFLRN